MAPTSYLHARGVTPEGVGASYIWHFDPCRSEAVTSDVRLLRVLAHLLLDQVRSEGVPELVQTLVELRDVYELAARPQVLPAPSRRDVTAASVERRTAPPFEIELE